MKHRITNNKLIGWRNSSGWVVTGAAHDNWALYIDFDNLVDKYGTGGWLRVDMREIARHLGQDVADAINTEAGRTLN